MKDKKLLEQIPEIKENTNYWIISGGKNKDLTDYFHKNNLIGLAWDRMKIEDIRNNEYNKIRETFHKKYAYLKNEKYKEEKSFKSAATIITKEIEQFVNQTRIGDIIILKDKYHKKVMFGEIESEPFYEEEHYDNLLINQEKGKCNKLIKIKWLKVKEINKISKVLKEAIQIKQAFVKIDLEDVKHDTNKEIYSLYVKGGYLHATFRVGTKDDIKFKDYIDFLNILYRESDDNGTMSIKSNVSSPGPIEVIGTIAEVYPLLTFIGLGLGGLMLNKVVKSSNLKKEKDSKYKKIEAALEIQEPGEDFLHGN